MAVLLTGDQTRLLRLRAQRLAGEKIGSQDAAVQVVKDVCGLQAQELPASVLGIRARSAGLLARDVEDARLQERSILRIWCMRGTLHLIAVEDYGWLLPLFGPVFIKASQRRFAQLGLDEETSAAAIRIIQKALADHGPLTRGEIIRQLSAHGLPAEGQAPIHLIRRAALDGILCEGPDRDREPAFVLVEDWIKPGPARDQEAALSELALRYLSAYGPAGPEDLANWSGLAVKEARSAFGAVADRLVQVELQGRPAWMLKSRRAWLEERSELPRSVRLLPKFDNYLLGYANRELSLAPTYEKRVHPGGGILNATLLVDGQVAGTWRTKRRRDRLEVILEPFQALSSEIYAGLEAERDDLARFLEVQLSQEASTWNAG